MNDQQEKFQDSRQYAEVVKREQPMFRRFKKKWKKNMMTKGQKRHRNKPYLPQNDARLLTNCLTPSKKHLY